jgi:chromosome partitioning protein
MVVTFISNKGGVGKTSLAYHVACFLADQAPTALFDGDPNRSALNWANRTPEAFRAKNLTVENVQMVAKVGRTVDHVVFDTTARPSVSDYEELARGTDLLVIPVNPDVMSFETALETLRTIRGLNADNVAILLTRVAHTQRRLADAVRRECESVEVRIFASEVRHFAAYQHAARLGVSVRDVAKIESQRDNTMEAWKDITAVGNELSTIISLVAAA